jgi:hypothetical protein
MWALSLTRERVCRLQLPLVLDKAVILNSLNWVKVKVKLRLTVSQSVSLGAEPHQIFITL